MAVNGVSECNRDITRFMVTFDEPISLEGAADQLIHMYRDFCDFELSRSVPKEGVGEFYFDLTFDEDGIMSVATFHKGNPSREYEVLKLRSEDFMGFNTYLRDEIMRKGL